MKAFLVDFWKFLRGQRNHPIYQRELTGWSYVRAWSPLRKGCLPLMIGGTVVTMACCGLTMLPIIIEESRSWPFILSVTVLSGLFFGEESINWIVGLLATALTATAISAEIEAQTYPLLRMTPIPPRQIALAKFSAAFQQLRTPLVFVMVVRALLMISVVVLAVILISVAEVWPDIIEFLRTLPKTTALSPVINLTASLSVMGLAVLLAAFYLSQPILNVGLYAAVGLYASSLARTRAGGLFGGAGLRVVLWVVTYTASQLIGVILQILIVPLMMFPASATWLEDLATNEPGLLVLGGIAIYVFWLILVIAGQIALTLLLLYLTGRRAERLPYR